MQPKRTIQRVCRQCGSDFLASPSAVNSGKGFLCSNRCRYDERRRIVHPVTISEDGLTALVPLVARDGTVRAHTLIDASDAEWVSEWPWRLSPTGYAFRGESHGIIRLHRAILGLTDGDGLDGDHIDHDTLNNRRSNLRSITHAENMQNTSGFKRATSSNHRGVGWDKSAGKWMAYTGVSGKRITIGRFSTEEEAADAARAGRARLLPYAVD